MCNFFLFVILFLCTVTDFSVAERARGMKFCMLVGLLPGQVFSPFGEIWTRGGSPSSTRSVYAEVTWGKNLAWEETLAVRLVGCQGSVGHSELVAAACTEASQGIRNWAQGSAGIRNWGCRHC